MSAMTGPLSAVWAGKAPMFFAFCAGGPTPVERAAIARTSATILIGLSFPFLGKNSKKLRRYSRLLARDIQAILARKTGKIIPAFGRFLLCLVALFARLQHAMRGTM